ncbi:hypothetical protein [Rhizobium sullae]|uniref:hypothetical protein n=1 Tax=Rhizobium sullae TaxID=50338 RepID=UPI00104DA5D3|nr:hypothetical protein [Rhizobium sullae]
MGDFFGNHKHLPFLSRRWRACFILLHAYKNRLHARNFDFNLQPVVNCNHIFISKAAVTHSARELIVKPAEDAVCGAEGFPIEKERAWPN